MSKPPKIKVMADVLCLAGDIGYPYSGIYREFLKQMNSDFKKVFIIAGNHEYYNSDKIQRPEFQFIQRFYTQIFDGCIGEEIFNIICHYFVIIYSNTTIVH